MKKILRIATIVALVLGFSCSQDDVSNPEPAASLPSKINVTDGRLVFPSATVFNSTRDALSDATNDDLDNWESRFAGFKSQRSILKEILKKDEKHKEAIDNLPMEDALKLKETIGDDFYFDESVLSNKNILDFDEDGVFYLKIEGYAPSIEKFVNRHGLVQIGDSIFSYSEGYIKVITDGNANKIKSLSDYNESNRKENVYVSTVKRETIEISLENGRSMLFNGTSDCTGYTTGGGQRVKGRAEALYSTPSGGQGTGPYIIYMYLRASNEYKGVFGWRSKDTSQLNINGWVDYYVTTYPVTTITDIITLNATTNGQTVSTITYDIYNVQSNYPIGYGLQGSLTYTGRHGSSCSL
ncbi:MAG: hypothetical protein RIG68_00690 [Imperialibacter sp.]|uniref:hypothetical protein n=1 Tax=Imperialibacter sp. TaxID=2038411 RepID=UPI0032EC7FD2